MKHFILGTAGHVDHGKSSLIKALTSVDTDRLPEEKKRGLSIDLGFAPLTLDDPDGSGQPIHLGIVDVPGHQRFLRNMIAGVGGFDAALLVVDCHEGVKPQTEEHLKILQLLQTRRGVVALSKADKSDEDALEIARWEMEELLKGTFLQGAPIVATSALTGEGLDQLKAELYRIFSTLEERSPIGVARMPIDRAFSKVGFGDVVTGSLWSGTLRVGQEVEVLPHGGRGRVRGLQVHGESVEEVRPGQRAAVNLSGFDKEGLKRGESLVSPPGAFPAGPRWAISLTLLEAQPKLLKRKAKATFFQGTSHHRVALNLVGEKESSLEVFGQIVFDGPVLLARGDRFLLRDETDQRLLGGGTVLAPEEKPFKRSQTGNHLKRYQGLAGTGEVGVVIGILSQKGGYAKEATVKKQQGLSAEEWESQLSLLLDSGEVVRVGKERLWLAQRLRELSESVGELLRRLAEAAPWMPGWKMPEIASLLRLKSGKDQGLDDVLELMVEEGHLQRHGPLFRPAGHEPALPPDAAQKAEALVETLEKEGFAPRDWEIVLGEASAGDKRLAGQLGDYLFGTERLVRLTEKLVTTARVMEGARILLKERGGNGFTASEARQHLDTSRKYIIPMLEWMDQQGWTVRSGDKRMIVED